MINGGEYDDDHDFIHHRNPVALRAQTSIWRPFGPLDFFPIHLTSNRIRWNKKSQGGMDMAILGEG